MRQPSQDQTGLLQIDKKRKSLDLDLLFLLKPVQLSDSTKVVEQSKHHTTIGELDEHVHPSLAHSLLVAVKRAHVGQDERNVVSERDDRVTSLVRFQVICHDRQRVQDGRACRRGRLVLLLGVFLVGWTLLSLFASHLGLQRVLLSGCNKSNYYALDVLDRIVELRVERKKKNLNF